MAPVNIPPSNKPGSEKITKKPVERRSELLCRVKYNNTLPDIPFDPKFISYPFDTNRFVQYKQTSLEKNYKHDLLTELDLGVNIDLINPESYEPLELGLKNDEEDDILLQDEATAQTDTKRSRCHNRTVTWLKKTEYIATEFNRYGTSNEKTETKVGFGVKKKLDIDKVDYVGRDGQISAVIRTFEAAKKQIVAHPEKPGVKPVEVLPVFPDFDLWKFPFAQVMFDAEPYKSEEYMSEAVLRGHADHVVMYFVPTEATLEKRKEDEEEGRDYTWDLEYEYIKTHEYNYKITNTHTQNKKELIENYFFIWRDNEVVYNELETRINLTKRRVKQASQGTSILAIKHRDLNESEKNCCSTRLEKIEPRKKKEEIEAAEKAKKAEQDKHEEGQKEADVEMEEEGACEDRGGENEDEDVGQESANSDEKSSSEADDKSDESGEEEESSDSEPEKVHRKKKDEKQHSKARVSPPTRKRAVNSDSEKSSTAASSGSSSASSDSEEEEEEEGTSSSSSSGDDDLKGQHHRQQKKKKEMSKHKLSAIFGSDSESDQ